MSDPIGTLRLEKYEHGFAVWLRLDPFFGEMRTGEWICIHSSHQNNIGARLEDGPVVRHTHIVGTVPNTPAATIEAAKKVAESDRYQRGDVDPTPMGLHTVCEALGERGFFCTWAPNHDGDHVAGDSVVICDVWPQ